MNIVVCDDEKITCSELEQMIVNYFRRKSMKQEVSVFYSGDALAAWLQKGGSVDILFLDIEIPGINGIKVGDYIRNVLENEQLILIYISSKMKYAMQLFKNRPFDFLVKPLTEDNVYPVLDRVCRIMKKIDSNFEYLSNGCVNYIPYKEILYFQSSGRQVNIIMRNEIRSFYGKLTDVEKTIPGSFFLNIHKSYLINYNYVEEYKYEQLRMVNGDVLNISRPKRMEIRRKVLEMETNEY